MKKFTQFLVGAFAAALIGVAGLAVADNTGSSNYFGFNPSTGLSGERGPLVALGVSPTVTGVTGCGTLTALTGGGTAGTVTLGTFTTTCTLTITFPSPAPHGWICTFNDRVTAAAVLRQASDSTTTCVTAANTSMVTADVVSFSAIGY